MNDEYYNLRAIEDLYTALVVDAVRTVEKSEHHEVAAEAADWLVETGVPLMNALGLKVNTSTVEPWARRQIALRQIARSIRRRAEKEASHAVQR